jgi:predicted transcriptional regulator
MQRRWRDGVRGPLRDYVETPRIALDCDTSLYVARQQMLDKQTWVAPVLCDGKFVGLLTLDTMRRILALRRNAQGAGPTAVEQS